MKKTNIISKITIILIIISIIFISFVGIYIKKDYKMVNIINKYLLGMEFEGTTDIKYIVDDSKISTIYDKDGKIVEKEDGKEYKKEDGYIIKEEKSNKDEILTKENYKKSKQILEKRLEMLLKNDEYKEYKQYEIKQNSNGNIIIKIPDKAYYNTIIENIIKKGNFELIDSSTKEVLMDNSDIKIAATVSGQENINTTKIYLQIQFNEEGTKKLEEISKIYVQKEENKTEEEKSENNSKKIEEIKKVSIKFDGTEYMSTYFGETIKTGQLNIPIGQDSDQSKINENVKTANNMSIIINTGIIPINYNQQINKVEPIINQMYINIFIYIFIGIYSIYFIYNIFKYKIDGLLVGIVQIGYIALLAITLRYVNIIITLEGILGIILSIIISMMFANILLKNKTEENYTKMILSFIYRIIPISIITIVFTFGKTLNISSFGKVMFWGIAICYIYNITFIKTIINVNRKD